MNRIHTTQIAVELLPDIDETLRTIAERHIELTARHIHRTAPDLDQAYGAIRHRTTTAAAQTCRALSHQLAEHATTELALAHQLADIADELDATDQLAHRTIADAPWGVAS